MEVQSLYSVLHHLAKENYFHKGIVLANLLKRSCDADFGLTSLKSGAFKERFAQVREIRFCYDCSKSNPFVLQVVLVRAPSTKLKMKFHLKNNVL